MGGKASLSSLRFEEIGEVAAGVFSTAVRPKAFDLYAMLSLRPGCKRLVGLEGFVLAA